MNVNLAQSNMIKQQLRTGDVLNPTVLNLYQSISREDFVPRNYKQFAYSDYNIPLSHDQKMLTPLEEATILQALDLEGSESVLEIGSGSGYLTALLAQCAAQVTSVDYFKDITEHTQRNLSKYNIDNVSLYTGDAHRGWMEQAPYDVIVITGALPKLDDIFKPQLMKHGKLFAIIGNGCAVRGSIFTLDDNDQWQEHMLFDTTVSPLVSPYKNSSFNF